MFKYLVILVILHLGVVLAQVQFRVVRQWRYLNYTWPTPEIYQEAINNKHYIPENVLTAGITYYDDWYYLAMPRMKDGVPATLGRITALPGGSTSPKITPFPTWDFNKLGDCNALQNVQNTEIDSKGRMWIIDGGHAGSLTENPTRNCRPKLVILDLKTNTTITTYTFPENVASITDSFLYDLVVDEDFVYITDNSKENPGIIVFSLNLHRSWKIRHSKTMKADVEAQNFMLNGVSVDALINIAGIALGPKVQQSGSNIVINQDREVFYCPLSSTHLYSISTSILRNEGSTNNEQDYPGAILDVGIKASQTDGMIMNNQGVLYYGLLGDNSIAQWNSQLPFASGQKVISRDSNYIQWTNSFTIDTKGNLIVLTNTLQRFIYGALDIRQYNFWVLSGQIGGKNYLYEDSSFNYKPLTHATPGIATTELPRVPINQNSATAQSSATPQSTLSSNPNNTDVIKVEKPAPDSASQSVLGLPVILSVIILKLFM